MISQILKKNFKVQLANKSLFLKSCLDMHYNQKSILPYNAQDFFQVVYEVENYHRFLPWCSNSIIHKRKGFQYFEAELFVNFKVYQDSYISKVSSDVTKDNYQIISLSNNISAFKHLQSTWKIKPLSEKSCQIDYDIEFEFKNILYQTVAQMFLDNVIKKINQSFEERTYQLTKQNYFQQNKLSVFVDLNKQQEVQKQVNEQVVSQQFKQVNQMNLQLQDTNSQINSNKNQDETFEQTSKSQLILENQQINTQNTYMSNKQSIIIEHDLIQQIEQHIKQMVQKNIAKEDEASIFLKIFLKSPEQQELITNAYKFFIINKGLINMNEDQANWKFLSVLRSSTLYK
ncbi:polyketide cyclase/dehydrase (macronuclear) [Tetrahymena thermophila SB210]|uniref:Polyketide cyclase/dehydrase n=1 Tax=Tetrahymena thermophila (strain SB210) TaxID=312017 RepID=Q22GI8_TETTS|nr:polyketide cyclase/dehydrase [Tetrahymena thermophila SB210]EAR84343.2 polyketide cyclase/dehydrase [Tetrahymena thermophila SB210]|eukprot:XP_001032006.2 polyketide cyclase/dehydrase [Tetrahymena thermophila SB210]